MDRITPGLLALFIGGGIVALAFVPIVIIEYRRRGGLSAGRLLGWIALLVYLIGVLAYTLLPLPDPADLSCAGVNLDPFAAIGDVRRDLADGASLLGSAAMQQVALNVVLFLPLGFLLRALFGRGVLVGALVGLAVSLAIEATQITGVWGLYSCAYRVFDVDDLIANTLGAVLGSIAAWVLLPRHGRAAAGPAAKAPRPVTATRRVLAMACDWLLVWLAAAALDVVVLIALRMLDGEPRTEVPPIGEIVVLAGMWIGVLVRATTPGETAVLLRGIDGRLPKPVGRSIRYLLGIGGYQLLVLFDLTLFAGLLALATFIVVIARRDRLGPAALAAGMTVADVREPATEAG